MAVDSWLAIRRGFAIVLAIVVTGCASADTRTKDEGGFVNGVQAVDAIVVRDDRGLEVARVEEVAADFDNGGVRGFGTGIGAVILSGDRGCELWVEADELPKNRDFFSHDCPHTLVDRRLCFSRPAVLVDYVAEDRGAPARWTIEGCAPVGPPRRRWENCVMDGDDLGAIVTTGDVEVSVGIGIAGGVVRADRRLRCARVDDTDSCPLQSIVVRGAPAVFDFHPPGQRGWWDACVALDEPAVVTVEVTTDCGMRAQLLPPRVE